MPSQSCLDQVMSVSLLPKSTFAIGVCHAVRSAARWHQWLRLGSLAHIDLMREIGSLVICSTQTWQTRVLQTVQPNACSRSVLIRCMPQSVHRIFSNAISGRRSTPESSSKRRNLPGAEEQASINRGRPFHVFACEIYQQIITEKLCSGHLAIYQRYAAVDLRTRRVQKSMLSFDVVPRETGHNLSFWKNVVRKPNRVIWSRESWDRLL